MPGFIPRCTGAPSDRRGQAARGRSPVWRASPTCFTSASTMAASGGPPTSAPRGRRCSDLALHRTAAGRPRAGALRCGEPAQRVLHRLRQWRRLAVHRLRLHVDGAVPIWRSIGPPRAGRARALSGVASQPNVFYIGFDNGGVWRSTDFGSTWTALFDNQPTGSIGAIAVAPSDPNIIYVGAGAGIIRPDLAVGDGMYKSTDAGKTWTHLALRDSQMIANIAVDPTNPNRLFVAALGHPYGPNPERGIFRSTDGGAHFDKVLYNDEYTSGNDVVIDPKDPNTVYACLWQQQQGFTENGAFGGAGGGIYKSTDGGSNWRKLIAGLPPIIEANLAIAASNPKVMYATVAPGAAPAAAGAATPAAGGRGGGRGGGGGGGGGGISFYKTTDGGENWFLATDDPRVAETGSQRHPPDTRPLGRIGGGDLPTITVDPKNENVVY